MLVVQVVNERPGASARTRRLTIAGESLPDWPPILAKTDRQPIDTRLRETNRPLARQIAELFDRIPTTGADAIRNARFHPESHTAMNGISK
ncbi:MULTISPECIES: hypothetical protein [Burkholderia]|uniref:hypothetical protein n=1 Tax=Burkholderia TaxID=32008 RepID=UPI0012E37020|nr:MULTISPECIES: hypothetical protein [Burkholderia]